jgi:hypothetical protein
MPLGTPRTGDRLDAKFIGVEIPFRDFPFGTEHLLSIFERVVQMPGVDLEGRLAGEMVKAPMIVNVFQELDPKGRHRTPPFPWQVARQMVNLTRSRRNVLSWINAGQQADSPASVPRFQSARFQKSDLVERGAAVAASWCSLKNGAVKAVSPCPATARRRVDLLDEKRQIPDSHEAKAQLCVPLPAPRFEQIQLMSADWFIPGR